MEEQLRHISARLEAIEASSSRHSLSPSPSDEDEQEEERLSRDDGEVDDYDGMDDYDQETEARTQPSLAEEQVSLLAVQALSQRVRLSDSSAS